jgi:hypothetical protein
VCELSANSGSVHQTKANWMGLVDEQSRWKAQVDNIFIESDPILCSIREIPDATRVYTVD